MNHSAESAWKILPQNGLATTVMIVLFIYLFVRHFIFVLMIFDIMIGWLRQFRWFPSQGRRLKALLHWAIALVLFGGFLAVGGSAGWIKFVPA